MRVTLHGSPADLFGVLQAIESAAPAAPIKLNCLRTIALIIFKLKIASQYPASAALFRVRQVRLPSLVVGILHQLPGDARDEIVLVGKPWHRTSMVDGVAMSVICEKYRSVTA